MERDGDDVRIKNFEWLILYFDYLNLFKECMEIVNNEVNEFFRGKVFDELSTYKI